jgi:uncharacterized damage-inducible protein DinB
MSYAETILPEFDHEMANTRKVLERIPDAKLDWRAHPKSNSIGWNANHLAELPGLAVPILTQPQFDFAPVDGPRYQSPKLRTCREIVELLDRNVAAARKAIAQATDDDMAKMWSLLSGGKSIFTRPRAASLRTIVLSHVIHHRAILSVYLRLNDIPVPGMYGPSGDE